MAPTTIQVRPAALAVAHRGEPRGCVENTIAAIRGALALRAHAVEVDVRVTSDGVAVLHHGECLSRVWQHRGQLARMTFAALRGIVPSVPTLAEALAELPADGPPLLVDITSTRAALAAHRAAVETGALAAPRPARSRTAVFRRPGEHLEARVWFCGAPRAMAALRAVDPDAVLMLSWDRLLPPDARLVDAVRPTFFNPWHHLLTQRRVAAWHRRGTLVSAWTVDDARRRRRLLDWGVDAIISNDVAGTVTAVRAA